MGLHAIGGDHGLGWHGVAPCVGPRPCPPPAPPVPPPPTVRWDDVPWWYPEEPCPDRWEAADPGPPPVAAPRPAAGDRPDYAVAALGDIPDLGQDPPPRPVERVEAMNWFHVTNLGTLLDVLA
jgi:hypothetical protein